MMVRFQARTQVRPSSYLAAKITPALFGCISALGGCAQSEAFDPTVELTTPALEHAHAEDHAQDVEARASLRDASGNQVGTIRFRPAGEATWVSVQAHVESGGIRGMHIHANDVPDNGVGCVADPAQPASTHFVSADGHFVSMPGTGHGHHAGDMPALFFTESGDASMQFLTDRFMVHDILDRAVILHVGADNYGNIPVGDKPEEYTPNDPAATDLTTRTGNAGARYACGVIGLEDTAQHPEE
jgi:superoxide dismutase, Cu-Zn family